MELHLTAIFTAPHFGELSDAEAWQGIRATLTGARDVTVEEYGVNADGTIYLDLAGTGADGIDINPGRLTLRYDG